MLEKIEIGKSYLNSNSQVITVKYVGDSYLIYTNIDGDENYGHKPDCISMWLEIPVEKKPTKFLAYVDADGGFFYSEERMSIHKSCKRIPSKDFDAIVED